MITRLYPKNILDKIEKEINLTGNSFSVETFVKIRLTFTLIIFITLIFIINLNYLTAALIALIYYYGSYYGLITRPIKRRRVAIEKEAIHFFELLALTLESGTNIENALKIITKHDDGILSHEFKLTLMEVKFGKSLNEALLDMNKRIPSSTINNAIINIHQSLTLGSSITDNLHTRINYLNELKVSKFKLKVSTIPLKVSIINILIFLPLILLIIWSPFIINFFT